MQGTRVQQTHTQMHAHTYAHSYTYTHMHIHARTDSTNHPHLAPLIALAHTLSHT